MQICGNFIAYLRRWPWTSRAKSCRSIRKELRQRLTTLAVGDAGREPHEPVVAVAAGEPILSCVGEDVGVGSSRPEDERAPRRHADDGWVWTARVNPNKGGWTWTRLTGRNCPLPGKILRQRRAGTTEFRRVLYIAFAFSRTSSIPPTYRNACSGRSSARPSVMSSKLLSVSAIFV